MHNFQCPELSFIRDLKNSPRRQFPIVLGEGLLPNSAGASSILVTWPGGGGSGSPGARGGGGGGR